MKKLTRRELEWYCSDIELVLNRIYVNNGCNVEQYRNVINAVNQILDNPKILKNEKKVK